MFERYGKCGSACGLYMGGWCVKCSPNPHPDSVMGMIDRLFPETVKVFMEPHAPATVSTRKPYKTGTIWEDEVSSGPNGDFLKFEVPGVDKDGITVKHEKNVLHVSVPERGFKRQYVADSEDYDIPKTTATLKNGILEVFVPKKPKKVLYFEVK